MTETDFLKIFDDYFTTLKRGKSNTNPKGVFCAYCDFLKYTRKNHHQTKCCEEWFKKNNIPDFGYGPSTRPGSIARYYYDKISILCKGEDFLWFVPSWTTLVGGASRKEPKENLKEITLADIFAQMNYIIARQDKMIALWQGGANA